MKSELKSPPSSPLNNNNQPVDLSSKPVSTASSASNDSKAEGGEDDVEPAVWEDAWESVLLAGDPPEDDGTPPLSRIDGTRGDDAR